MVSSPSLDHIWDRCSDLAHELRVVGKSNCIHADSDLNPIYIGHSTLREWIDSEVECFWEGFSDEVIDWIDHITGVCRFVEFRRKYLEFDDGILAGMLAPEVSMDTKRELMARDTTSMAFSSYSSKFGKIGPAGIPAMVSKKWWKRYRDRGREVHYGIPRSQAYRSPTCRTHIQSGGRSGDTEAIHQKNN